MDRLICGDVGYGKTEIAVRAAFKAVQDGKQVAVLVPTTLLVQQHFYTFSERMSGVPGHDQGAVAGSRPTRRRARSSRGCADGTVDIVIGTHRLLNPDIRFKDLGLIIVDEEQRFGVEHKEQLKRLRTVGRRAVDVGDADPAHAGDGDHRHPRDVDDHHPARGAAPGADLRRRATRTGRSPPPSAASCCARARSSTSTTGSSRSRRPRRKIRELVPEARVAAAHGQMGEDPLEQVMVDFWEKEFDVLVCTTIVESGIDIPNANTLIVERADMLGLSQLHQLRGRVGRSPRAGLRLLPLPAGEAAHRDRPRAAGHHRPAHRPRRRHVVAMKDLEIRGAGNLLGGEQSGHIADVGFDLYVRMVGEAVARVPGRRRARGRARSRSSCRSTPTCRTTTSRASGCGWRCTSGSPRCAPTRTSTCCARRWQDRYGEPPQRGQLAAAGRPVPGAGPAGRRRRGHDRRQERPVRAGRRCPTRGWSGSSGSTRSRSSRRRSRRSWCRARWPRGGSRVKPLDGIALLEWARQVIDAVIDPPDSTPTKEPA